MSVRRRFVVLLVCTVWICLVPASTSPVQASRQKPRWYDSIRRQIFKDEELRKCCSTSPVHRFLKNRQLKGVVLVADAASYERQDQYLKGPGLVLVSLCIQFVESAKQAVHGITKRNGAPKQPKEEKTKKGKTKDKKLDQGTLNKLLWEASEEGRTTDVVRLIAKGANVTVRDAEDWLRWGALHQAAAYAHPAVVEVLLMAGADANTPDWDHYTPLHYAAYLGQRRHASIAKALLRYGASLHAQTWDGKTPLDLSNLYGNHEVTEVLRDAIQKENAQRTWLQRVMWRPPRARLDEVGIRVDREKFLDELTRQYPEPIPARDVEKYEQMLAAQKNKTTAAQE